MLTEKIENEMMLDIANSTVADVMDALDRATEPHVIQQLTETLAEANKDAKYWFNEVANYEEDLIYNELFPEGLEDYDMEE